MIWARPVDDVQLRALDAMARRIPYLGRSTGVALVAASAQVGDAPVETGPDRVVFEPCDLLDGEVSLRVPYPGFVEELEAQFDAGRPAWEVTRYRGYRRRPTTDIDSAAAAAARDAVVPSVYTDVLVFRFSGLRPDARLTVELTEAFRSAVLQATRGQAPPVLHGHGAPGRPHVAFLALPDVDHDQADGHLLGLAVAVPELPEAERVAVLRAVLGLRQRDLPIVELSVPRLGTVELLYQPGLIRPWGASPQRWRQGSHRWVSATPIVLDRFPRRPEQIEDEVRYCLRTVGLPEPVQVRISPQPLLRGAARLRPADLPRQARGRLFRHIAVTFDRRVSGPVLVGAGRYLGVGLLAPVRSEGRDA
jgi:CRISPR-associated protein Csb2